MRYPDRRCKPCQKLFDSRLHAQKNARYKQAYAYLYGHAWRKQRQAYLDKHVQCRICWERNVISRATVVDHIVPHDGDYALVWDVSNNWQPLCKRCHGQKTWREKLAPVADE